MSFKVAIYSYKRPDTIEKDTIDTILSKQIKPSQIYIFVANETQKILYEKYVSKDKYNKIVVGRKGKNYQINFVREYFKQGEKILNLDDDIIKIAYKYNNLILDLENLYSYSELMFKVMKKYKTGLAGPTLRRGLIGLSNKMILDFHQINGGLYWSINDKNKKLRLYESKGCEDLELSLKSWQLYGWTLMTHEITYWDNSRNALRKERKSLFDRHAMKQTQFKFLSKYPHLFKIKEVKNLDFVYSHVSQPNRKVIKLNERRL